MKVDYDAGIRRKANDPANGAPSEVMMDDREVAFAKAAPETKSTDRIEHATRPVYRACYSSGILKILDERPARAEKPGVHLIFLRIEASSQRSDDPCRPGLFELSGTQ